MTQHAPRPDSGKKPPPTGQAYDRWSKPAEEVVPAELLEQKFWWLHWHFGNGRNGGAGRLLVSPAVWKDQKNLKIEMTDKPNGGKTSMTKSECSFCKENIIENVIVYMHCKYLKLPKLPQKKWYQTYKWVLRFAVNVFICTLFLSPTQSWSLQPTVCITCNEFSSVSTMVRDGKIERKLARDKIRMLLPQLAEYYDKNGNKKYSRNEWVYPLEGYNIVTSGNNKGRDYVASGYDYFAGNRHGGHPSFDLFIRDKNQVSLDLTTKAPVKVLSMTGGIVVAVEKEWAIDSKLRGGKYIWVYDPVGDGLVYYAHNSEIKVDVGDVVKPGDVIAFVGRSGLNAYKKRSPTHLHLTYLQIKDGYPRPENIYPELERIGKKR